MITRFDTRPRTARLLYGFNPANYQDRDTRTQPGSSNYDRSTFWEDVVRLFLDAKADDSRPSLREFMVMDAAAYDVAKCLQPFIGAQHVGNYRRRDTEKPTSLVFLDFDKCPLGDYERVCEWLRDQEFSWLMHHSTGHRSALKVDSYGMFTDSFRVIIPLAEPLDGDQRQAAAYHMAGIIREETGVIAGPESWSRGRMFYLPPRGAYVTTSPYGRSSALGLWRPGGLENLSRGVATENHDFTADLTELRDALNACDPDVGWTDETPDGVACGHFAIGSAWLRAGGDEDTLIDWMARRQSPMTVAPPERYDRIVATLNSTGAVYGPATIYANARRNGWQTQDEQEMSEAMKLIPANSWVHKL